jgi:type II secretory pathway pseudopilin PulG
MFSPTLRARREDGFTLVEVTIILLVLVILSTIMLPQLGNFNRLARYVKVKEDLGALCASFKKFLDEVMVNGPFEQPGGGVAPPEWPIGLLVGPGSAPAINPSVDHKTEFGDWSSDAPDDVGTISVETDVRGFQVVDFMTDRLENHLQRNDPMGYGGSSYWDRYKNVIDDPSVGAFFGWRGPYFDQITSDPWGTRYAINTFGLHYSDRGYHFSSAVVCYSAGPNKAADSGFNQPMGEDPFGWVTGGDDMIAILTAMGPF